MPTPSNTMNLPLLAISTIVDGCSQQKFPTGLTRHNVSADGSCLYHCIAELYNQYKPSQTSKSMRDVRNELADWILKNIDRFAAMYFNHENKELTDEALNKLLNDVRGCQWGGLLETEAIAEMYDVDINFWDTFDGKTTPKLMFVLMSSGQRPEAPRKPWNLIRQKDHFNYAVEGSVAYPDAYPQELNMTAEERARLLQRRRERANERKTQSEASIHEQLRQRAERLKAQSTLKPDDSTCNMTTGGGACNLKSPVKLIDESPELGADVVTALNEKMFSFRNMMLKQATNASTEFTEQYMTLSYIRDKVRTVHSNTDTSAHFIAFRARRPP
jgi:hypothetical protein